MHGVVYLNLDNAEDVYRLTQINGYKFDEVQELLNQLSPRAPLLGEREVEEKSTFNANFNLVLAVDKDTGKILGMATLYVVETLMVRKGLIEDVVVLERYRGQGIGRKLVEMLMAIAREKELAYVDLTSHPTRAVANRMYQELGFERRDTNVYRLKLKTS